MLLEPGFDADGSLSGWACYHQGNHVGSLCRTKPRRWLVNDIDGAVVGVFKTRKEAMALLHRIAVGAAHKDHMAAFRATDLSPREKSDRIAATRIALQEASHEAAKACRATR